MSWEKERQAVVDAAQKMLNLGLVAATSGNVSVYLGEENDSRLLAITPMSMPYQGMKADDTVVINFEGDVIEGNGNPSSESMTHIAVYDARPDVKSVIHTHSVYASILAVTGTDLPPILDELVTYLGGPIKVAEYGFSGTQELGENACAALEDRNAVIVRNHGALCVGRTVDEALRSCELLERAAKVYVHASALGNIELIPTDAVEAERSIFKMLQGRGTEKLGL